jgi:hypothetical protein
MVMLKALRAITERIAVRAGIVIRVAFPRKAKGATPL